MAGQNAPAARAPALARKIADLTGLYGRSGMDQGGPGRAKWEEPKDHRKKERKKATGGGPLWRR